MHNEPSEMISEYKSEIMSKSGVGTHLANGPWKKCLNCIFPTKYGIPNSLKG